MKLGAHMSAAGGLYKAFARAQEATCETMMVFTKSNRQWKAKDIAPEDVALYEEAQAAHEAIAPVAVHASYLINMASPKDELWEKSVVALKVEIERAATYNIPLLVFHPGSHVKSGEEAGMARIAAGLQRLLKETAVSAPNTTICLEIMAGQGTNIGGTFEHLAHIIEEAGGDERLGVCFDTCHAFAAGYDIRSADAYEDTMAQFDSVIGLDRLKFFHFNDSKFELGQHKDRHAHIGEGFIGLEGFANFVNDSRFENHPAHLETPKVKELDDGTEVEMDVVNMATLRRLIK